SVALALMDQSALKIAAAIALDRTKNVTEKLENVSLDALPVTMEQNVNPNVALALMDQSALKTAAAIALDRTKNVTTKLENVSLDALPVTMEQNVNPVSQPRQFKCSKNDLNKAVQDAQAPFFLII
ncbi:hypothetical protein ElyMa_005484800, partial [Elysia marginata]